MDHLKQTAQTILDNLIYMQGNYKTEKNGGENREVWRFKKLVEGFLGRQMIKRNIRRVENFKGEIRSILHYLFALSSRCSSMALASLSCDWRFSGRYSSTFWKSCFHLFSALSSCQIRYIFMHTHTHIRITESTSFLFFFFFQLQDSIKKLSLASAGRIGRVSVARREVFSGQAKLTALHRGRPRQCR